MPIIEQWHRGVSCCDPVWEEAYQRFESPDEEIGKFRRRMVSLGALNWHRESMIVALFSLRLASIPSLMFLAIQEVLL